MFPRRRNHHDRSEATLTFLSCLKCPGWVNWNSVPVTIFSFLLPREIDIPRRRRGGNVGIRRRCFLPDFQARWEEGETRGLSFPRFPRGGISTAPSISVCSERSDAVRALVGVLFLASISRFFSLLAKN